MGDVKLMIGMLASSKAGHDKNKIYVIIGETEEYVMLADGEYKCMANPKKKRKKHIQVIKHFERSDELCSDLEIKRVIKNYRKRLECNKQK